MVEGYLQKRLRACLDRRDFLKIMGMLGVGLATPSVAATLESLKFNKDLYKVKRTLPLMGTFVTITVLDPSRDKAEEAVGKAFREIERLTVLLNRHADDTPVSQLNREGVLRDTAPEIGEVLVRADHFHRLSYGAFDITVKPLVDLYKESFTQTGNPPDIQRIGDTLKLIGAAQISRNGNEIRFLKEGMGITLDGIAKGYIADKSADRLREMGIRHGLVNAGGDIRAIGDSGKGKPWKVAIRNPWEKGKYLEIISLANEAVATSGNYEVYFDREKLFHHIVSPKTGYSPRLAASVSTLAKTVTDADALSTAAFVLEPKEGKAFIDSIPGAECLIVDSKRLRIKSKGWPII